MCTVELIVQVVPDYGTLFLIIQVCDTVTSCAIAVVTQALWALLKLNVVCILA